MTGIIECITNLSKKGKAKEHAVSDNILLMSKLIKPIDTENVRSFIGHGMSNVNVNDVKICNHP